MKAVEVSNLMQKIRTRVNWNHTVDLFIMGDPETEVRAIAVAGRQRLAQLPDLPTMIESGMPDFEADSWNGLFAPAGTPPDIIAKLAKATIAILKSDEIAEKFATISATPVGSTPEQFKQYVHEEIVKWGQVAKQAGAKIE